MSPKGDIRFLLRARQRASCPWEGLPPAWPIFNSQNAPKHKPAPLLPRTALAIPCTPPFRLQKPPTVFIFWVRRDADPPTNNPRGSAPGAPGRAFLRHGPFSIHKKPQKPLPTTALLPQHPPIPTAARTRFITRSETSRAFSAPSASTRSTKAISPKISSRLTRKGAKYSQIPTKRRFFRSP